VFWPIVRFGGAPWMWSVGQSIFSKLLPKPLWDRWYPNIWPFHLLLGWHTGWCRFCSFIVLIAAILSLNSKVLGLPRFFIDFGFVPKKGEIFSYETSFVRVLPTPWMLLPLQSYRFWPWPCWSNPRPPFIHQLGTRCCISRKAALLSPVISR